MRILVPDFEIDFVLVSAMYQHKYLLSCVA